MRNVESLDVVTSRGLRLTLEGYSPGPLHSTAEPGRTKPFGASSRSWASGFSCREQTEQVTGRPTLHVADVLRLALVSD